MLPLPPLPPPSSTKPLLQSHQLVSQRRLPPIATLAAEVVSDCLGERNLQQPPYLAQAAMPLGISAPASGTLITTSPVAASTIARALATGKAEELAEPALVHASSQQSAHLVSNIKSGNAFIQAQATSIPALAPLPEIVGTGVPANVISNPTAAGVAISTSVTSCHGPAMTPRRRTGSHKLTDSQVYERLKQLVSKGDPFSKYKLVEKIGQGSVALFGCYK
ncbi:unnamed protein product [Protopolystoma xenopodis]|uniref:Uncharacterized protein n=1 Tax=Protopolystoma xenopodis TaxID=117903 RepID=A0A3S5FE15_9PLAT|nr:unnamed protein product [Protopolystoma xenopodis]